MQLRIILVFSIVTGPASYCLDLHDEVLPLLLHKLGNSTLPHLIYDNVWGSEISPMCIL